ncbi:MAG: hypothetical protein WC223_05025 [Bacteroidales bacterium]|jgi:hypothetical protein
MKKQDIKTGMVMLVQGKSFLAKLIAFFQRALAIYNKKDAKLTHAGIFQWFTYKGVYDLYVVESLKDGIKATPFDKYISEGRILYIGTFKFGVWDDKKMNDLIELNNQFIDKTHYNKDGLLREALRCTIFRITGIDIYLPDDDMLQDWMCGQFVMFDYQILYGVFSEWLKGTPIEIYESGLFDFELFERN